MTEDRKRLLDMLAEGKITADEAERLLSAIEEPSAGGDGLSGSGAPESGQARYLRVTVEPNADTEHEVSDRVNVRVPLALIRAGMKLASLIPSVAAGPLKEALEKQGLDLDLSYLNPQDLDGLVDALRDLEVNVENQQQTVHVYVE